MRTVEQRLASLESSLNRWRLAAVGMAVLLALGVVLAAGPAAPADLTVKSLRVVNSKGEVVVAIQANDKDGGTFAAYTADGTPVVTAGESQGGGGIYLTRPGAGLAAVGLEVNSDTPIIGVTGSDGRSRASIFVSEDEGHIKTMAKGGKETAWESQSVNPQLRQ